MQCIGRRQSLVLVVVVVVVVVVVRVFEGGKGSAANPGGGLGKGNSVSFIKSCANVVVF